MQLTGYGHPAVRATHAKTLEFSADAAITERATCILAVATTARADQAPDRLAGPIRITIEAAGQRFSVDADANSAWQPGGAAVVRRGSARLPGTLAINASAAACDVPRPLVAALRDPATRVDVTVEPRPGPVQGPPTVVLYAADPTVGGDARLAAELAAADVVLAQDAGARALTGRSDPRPATVTGRVLVVATEALPGTALPAHRARIETVGLSPSLAAVAAASCWGIGGPGPVVISEAQLGPAQVRALLLRTPATHRLVLDTDRPGLAALLSAARDVRGSELAVVAAPLSDPVLVGTSDPVGHLAGDRLAVCLAPPAPTGDELLDPATRAALDQLLAAGIATKTAATVLSTLTGRSQRQAYDTVLAIRAGRAAAPGD